MILLYEDTMVYNQQTDGWPPILNNAAYSNFSSLLINTTTLFLLALSQGMELGRGWG